MMFYWMLLLTTSIVFASTNEVEVRRHEIAGLMSKAICDHEVCQTCFLHVIQSLMTPDLVTQRSSLIELDNCFDIYNTRERFLACRKGIAAFLEAKIRLGVLCSTRPGDTRAIETTAHKMLLCLSAGAEAIITGHCGNVNPNILVSDSTKNSPAEHTPVEETSAVMFQKSGSYEHFSDEWSDSSEGNHTSHLPESKPQHTSINPSDICNDSREKYLKELARKGRNQYRNIRVLKRKNQQKIQPPPLKSSSISKYTERVTVAPSNQNPSPTRADYSIKQTEGIVNKGRGSYEGSTEISMEDYNRRTHRNQISDGPISYVRPKDEQRKDAIVMVTGNKSGVLSNSREVNQVISRDSEPSEYLMEIKNPQNESKIASQIEETVEEFHWPFISQEKPDNSKSKLDTPSKPFVRTNYINHSEISLSEEVDRSEAVPSGYQERSDPTTPMKINLIDDFSEGLTDFNPNRRQSFNSRTSPRPQFDKSDAKSSDRSEDITQYSNPHFQKEKFIMTIKDEPHTLNMMTNNKSRYEGAGVAPNMSLNNKAPRDDVRKKPRRDSELRARFESYNFDTISEDEELLTSPEQDTSEEPEVYKEDDSHSGNGSGEEEFIEFEHPNLTLKPLSKRNNDDTISISSIRRRLHPDFQHGTEHSGETEVEDLQDLSEGNNTLDNPISIPISPSYNLSTSSVMNVSISLGVLSKTSLPVYFKVNLQGAPQRSLRIDVPIQNVTEFPAGEVSPSKSDVDTSKEMKARVVNIRQTLPLKSAMKRSGGGKPVLFTADELVEANAIGNLTPESVSNKQPAYIADQGQSKVDISREFLTRALKASDADACRRVISRIRDFSDDEIVFLKEA